MKIKLNFLVFLPLISTSLCAQIPNGGFENWTTLGSYQNPDGWATMNNTTASYSLFTATKASPGNPGSSYLKLTSKNIGGSVVNGIAVSGKLDTLTKLPISGFAFNQRPASFGGKWQHMIYGSSQGGLSVLLTKWNQTQSKRDTIANGAVTLAGMAMNWANFSFNLMYIDSFRYPDSCIIFLRASGSSPANNDYLWVDGLAFTGTVAVLPPPNPVGINESENSLAEGFLLYPNPANGNVNVSINLNTAQQMTVDVFDAQGKLIRSNIIEATQGNCMVEINLAGVTKGIYSIRIHSKEILLSRKVVIE